MNGPNLNLSEIHCALANARYALEYWEREARVQGRGEEWITGPNERGKRECDTLRALEAVIRPLAYGRAS